MTSTNYRMALVLIGALIVIVLLWGVYWLGIQRGFVIGLKFEHDALSLNLARVAALKSRAEESVDAGVSLLLDDELAWQESQLKATRELIEFSTYRRLITESPTAFSTFNHLYRQPLNDHGKLRELREYVSPTPE